MEKSREPAAPDWRFWSALDEVELPQAIALSLNFDPDRIRYRTDDLKVLVAAWVGFLVVDASCFRSSEEGERFTLRFRLLKTVLPSREHFGPSPLRHDTARRTMVRLREFARWCAPLEIFQPVPIELLRLTEAPITAPPEVRPPLVAIAQSWDVAERLPRFGPPTAPAPEPAPQAAPPTPPAPVQRLAAQDAAIIASLRNAGHNPLALPMYKLGKPGVKSATREALGDTGIWAGSTVFEKAWERLTRNGNIAYVR